MNEITLLITFISERAEEVLADLTVLACMRFST